MKSDFIFIFYFDIEVVNYNRPKHRDDGFCAVGMAACTCASILFDCRHVHGDQGKSLFGTRCCIYNI